MVVRRTWSLFPASALLGGCGGPSPGRLRVAAGDESGVYFAFARLLAARLEERVDQLRVEVLTTGGTVDNYRRLARGEADLGLGLADSVVANANAWGTPASAAHWSSSSGEPPMRGCGREASRHPPSVRSPSGTRCECWTSVPSFRGWRPCRATSTSPAAARLLPDFVLGLQYLTPGSMIQTTPVPLHPGAIAAYRRLHG